MRILILGNSLHFSQSLSAFLTNSSSAQRSSLRFKSEIVQFELVIGGVSTESCEQEASVWGLEALQADGIIYALEYKLVFGKV